MEKPTIQPSQDRGIRTGTAVTRRDGWQTSGGTAVARMSRSGSGQSPVPHRPRQRGESMTAKKQSTTSGEAADAGETRGPESVAPWGTTRGIDQDAPWGLEEDSPKEEGSEPTAVAEGRRGERRAAQPASAGGDGLGTVEPTPVPRGGTGVDPRHAGPAPVSRREFHRCPGRELPRRTDRHATGGRLTGPGRLTGSSVGPVWHPRGMNWHSPPSPPSPRSVTTRTRP